jgi:hypothetical protein
VNETLALLSARGALVVSEVYADAHGPEPAQEWVELVNAGSAPVDLAGFVLEDGAGATELPGGVLEAGGYALVMNPEFDAISDVAPRSSALIVTVDRIGSQGLANQGESLRLKDPEGNVVSRFPALAGRRGVSVARRAPWSLDNDAVAFGLHASPGSSPGAENRLEP